MKARSQNACGAQTHENLSVGPEKQIPTTLTTFNTSGLSEMKLHIWTGLLSVLSLLTSAQLAPSPDADDASPDGAPTGPQDPDDRYVCSYTASPPRRNIGKGTSLGGWLVLEPW